MDQKPRTRYQGEKPREYVPRYGADCTQEYRDKRTFEIVPESEYRTAYKITYQWKKAEYEDGKGKKKYFEYARVFRRTSEGQETIGQITEYTTEDRLKSMLYRFYNPGHASGFSFSGRVRLSGDSEESRKEKKSKMPYVAIPSEDVSRYDLRVDDEVKITLINKHGEEYSEFYHLSLTANNEEENKQSLIVPLPKFKRLVVFKHPLTGVQTFRYVTKKIYTEHTHGLKIGETPLYPFTYSRNHERHLIMVPCHRFIDEGETVSVTLDPEEYTHHKFMSRMGRFDFARETLLTLCKPSRQGKGKKLPRGGSAEDPSELPEDTTED